MSLLYPHGQKSEWLAQAKAITSGKIKTSSSDIPMLIAWLKDMNWPGALEISQFLQSYGNELILPVDTVLKSDDLIWKHWVLAAFADSFDRDFWVPLKDELVRIAFKWDPEGAHIDGLYILAKCRLVNFDQIMAAVNLMKQLPESDLEDYQKIDALIADKVTTDARMDKVTDALGNQ